MTSLTLLLVRQWHSSPLIHVLRYRTQFIRKNGNLNSQNRWNNKHCRNKSTNACWPCQFSFRKTVPPCRATPKHFSKLKRIDGTVFFWNQKPGTVSTHNIVSFRQLIWVNHGKTVSVLSNLQNYSTALIVRGINCCNRLQLLPATCYLLPATYYVLSTTYYVLLTT